MSNTFTLGWIWMDPEVKGVRQAERRAHADSRGIVRRAHAAGELHAKAGMECRVIGLLGVGGLRVVGLHARGARAGRCNGCTRECAGCWQSVAMHTRGVHGQVEGVRETRGS